MDIRPVLIVGRYKVQAEWRQLLSVRTETCPCPDNCGRLIHIPAYGQVITQARVPYEDWEKWSKRNPTAGSDKLSDFVQRYLPRPVDTD